MLWEKYNSLDEYFSSDELNEYREAIKNFKKPSLQEEEFDLDKINFLEVINYPISWWIKALDKELWGQPTGKYTMLYGWPSTWKTTLTLQIAIDNQNRWNNVCYLSFEMPKKDFIVQNMRTRAWIKNVWVGEWILPTPSQQCIMKEFIESIRNIEIKWFINQPSLENFKEILKSLEDKEYVQIIIDNLWMIWRADNKDEMQLYWEISAYIKEYCDRTGIAVLLLHHTNKWSEQWNGKRWFSAFRWNGKIADDCDYVVQLQREYREDWTTESTIKVEKDRISGRNWYTMPLMFNNWRFSWLVME